MSAGDVIAQAHKRSARACFYLVTLLVKQRGNREWLEAALGELEAAANDIRSLLTATAPSGRVGVPTKGDQDNGSTDARG